MPSEYRKEPSTEIVVKHKNSTGIVQADINHNDDVTMILSSTDKRKQRVAVERAAEIPLSKTIRSVRILKSVQKTSPAQSCTEDSQNSPHRVKLPTNSISRKSASEQQPINNSSVSTVQLSDTSASTSRKVGIIEQTCDKSRNISSKSPMQSGKSFTTITTKEAITKRRNEMIVTNKSEIISSRTTKNMSPRKPRFGTSGTSSPSVTSAKNSTSIRMTKKSTSCTTDAEIPCTSNSSIENSLQRTRAANEFVTLAVQEQNVGSQSFWGTTTHIKSSATATKGVAHSNEHIARPTSLSNHDSSSSSKSASTVSRPKSIPQRVLAASDATSLTQAVPPRSSPSTPRRPVRATSKSGSQVPNSAPVTVPNLHNRTMKRADSCSTASRPLLIKTGAVSRPRWK